MHSDGVNVSLLVIDLLKELILVELGRDDSAVLSDGLLEFAVNLELSEGCLLVSTVSKVENAAVILIGIALP